MYYMVTCAECVVVGEHLELLARGAAGLGRDDRHIRPPGLRGGLQPVLVTAPSYHLERNKVMKSVKIGDV